ncbi:FAD-dependent tricarballylate dehydrogenase TcuA [Cellulomonas dongxiuzhuiae]|uniref:FAD-dependent tricarballylate dehydrogenase TcuA n=1 Tax=Cellulomonas dongxiuzhuiae TaxID=2819979 RepID=A0ABX8GGK4_9CELL|nr:FAD-dependent tricarballylate dehydrogenase TcuA [Cellulomonas dongxiuzhuiae]MBO3093514.1 FAD-dependent tricarballylate dehydrogenase TcuA [Cellulomonas dongxiuzhuiae]QWC14646.1 FAD-dependent tricarballylate dehydrogenase TcuA [Cellulomonas dongxiuzhuiae]
MSEHVDVVVVGAGNAGFCAALAAAERGRRVLVLEKAPQELAGGNSYFTHGATRFVHDGLDDVRSLVEPDERFGITTVPPYTAEEYEADITLLSGGRNDEDRTRVLVAESHDAMSWLRGLGMRYELMYGRQAYFLEDGSVLFWGGLHVGNVDGGIGMIADYTRIARERGIEIRYGSRVTSLVRDGDGPVRGVVVSGPDGDPYTVGAESVVLAAGGFHASPEMRVQHFGEQWREAVVRGTPSSTGDLIVAAQAVGAALDGDYDAPHATMIDAFHSANSSNRELTNRLARLSYPLGIIVNRAGRRFVDEGEGFRNYTYSRIGKEVLKQPDGLAFQIFDDSVRLHLRSDQYAMPGATVVTADTVEELATRAGIDVEGLVATVAEFNAAVDEARPFDPAVLDGRAARVEPPKSNWAVALENAPLWCYPVTCGITFTYGGLASDADARVLDGTGRPIPGLFVAGEMMGGLFWGGYPGGAGLASGQVFGRRAGASA